VYNNNPELLKAMMQTHLEEVVANEAPINHMLADDL
jgi:hypothetical protein